MYVLSHTCYPIVFEVLNTSSNTFVGSPFQDWEFEDGGVPTPEIVEVWIDLLDAVFATCRDSDDSEAPAIPETIAVHCRSGLGRAPVLVCLALIEAGMEVVDQKGMVLNPVRGNWSLSDKDLSINYILTSEKA